jgi:hypothetical protein
MSWQPPNPATINLSNPSSSSTSLDSSQPSRTSFAGTRTKQNELSSQHSSIQNKQQTQRSGPNLAEPSTQGSLWLLLALRPSACTSKKAMYLAGMIIFLPLRVLGILTRLLTLTIILLPVALVLDTALSAPYLYFKHKLKGWK